MPKLTIHNARDLRVTNVFPENGQSLTFEAGGMEVQLFGLEPDVLSALLRHLPIDKDFSCTWYSTSGEGQFERTQDMVTTLQKVAEAAR